jgi:hypothetical protein
VSDASATGAPATATPGVVLGAVTLQLSPATAVGAPEDAVRFTIVPSSQQADVLRLSARISDSAGDVLASHDWTGVSSGPGARSVSFTWQVPSQLAGGTYRVAVTGAAQSGAAVQSASAIVDVQTQLTACASTSGPRVLAQASQAPVEQVGVVFLQQTLDCYWTDGQVVLSLDTAGKLPFAVDDAMQLVVQRPDGTLAGWEHDFSNACQVVTEIPPQDISGLFQPGINRLTLQLSDRCGTMAGNETLYLTAGEGDGEPAPVECAALEAIVRDVFEPLAHALGLGGGASVSCASALDNMDAVDGQPAG